MYTKKTRRMAAFVCAAFLLITLFSLLFIVKEADHDCTGEDCPICACIHQAEETLRRIGSGTFAAAVPLVITVLAAVMTACTFFAVTDTSLVGRKVRLDD